jgi:hypothetical protein
VDVREERLRIRHLVSQSERVDARFRLLAPYNLRRPDEELRLLLGWTWPEVRLIPDFPLVHPVLIVMHHRTNPVIPGGSGTGRLRECAAQPGAAAFRIELVAIENLP